MGTTRKDIEAAIEWAKETGREVVRVEFAPGDGDGIKTVGGISCAPADVARLCPRRRLSLAVLDTGSHMHLEGLAARRLVKCRGAVLDDIEAEVEAIEPD
jgi:hypothetical protein